MKYLSCEKHPAKYVFVVHMDETKLMENGSPDPDFVAGFEWAITVPAGQTETAYLYNINKVIEGIVAEKMGTGTVVRLGDISQIKLSDIVSPVLPNLPDLPVIGGLL